MALPQLVHFTLTRTVTAGTTARKKTKVFVSVFGHRDGLLGVGAAATDSIFKSKTGRSEQRLAGGRAGKTHCLRLSSARKAHKNTSSAHTHRRVEPSGGKCEGSSGAREGWRNSVNSPRMNLGRRREPGGVRLFFNLFARADGREKVTCRAKTTDACFLGLVFSSFICDIKFPSLWNP